MRAREWARIARLTPDQFRDWLASKKPEQDVGALMDGGSCPIHHFIEERLGFDLNCGDSTLAEHWAPEWHPTMTHETPMWMSRFMWKLHERYSEARGVYRATAALALNALDASKSY